MHCMIIINKISFRFPYNFPNNINSVLQLDDNDKIKMNSMYFMLIFFEIKSGWAKS